MSFLRNLFFCLLFVFGFFLISLSQVPEGRTCGTPEADSARRALYPEVGTKAEFESWITRKMAEQRFRPREVLTLPVIVHIVHDGEPAGTGNNISYAQVVSQIEVLNEDFRRIQGTPGYNTHPDGADTEIEFCLATIDTSGNPLVEPGVHRIDRNTKGWNAPPYSMSYSDQVVKPQSSWNPNDYLNIWVMPLSSGLLGFAQTPDASTLDDIPLIGGSAGADGVVIRPTSFGRVGNVNAPYDKGRTTTHELGHFFGLIHTSGDGGCAFDDGCDDTPPTNGQNYGCPTNESSCGQQSMIENYLEYTDDACMNIFTQCQKLRMQTVLANSPRRQSLANSNACTQEVPPAAFFTASATVACAGQSIQFTDMSSNTPNGWAWTFQGGMPASSANQNPIVQYNSPGLYEVSLTATNSFGSTTNTITGYIQVNASGPAAFFTEDFEGGIPMDWTIDNPDGAFGWATRTVSGQASGTNAAWVNCYQYPTAGEIDGLITPAIDLQYYQNVTLSFQHAYRRYSDGGSPSDDSLIVRASTDGGVTFPFLLVALGENGNNEFATGPDTTGLFIPGKANDWCFGAAGNCQTVDLSDFDGKSDLRLRFETVNDYGNAIYLDNIVIYGTCFVTSTDDEWIAPPITVYPNPTDGDLTVDLTSNLFEEATLTIYQIDGQQVLTERRQLQPGFTSWNLSVEKLPAGIYLLSVSQGNHRQIRKLIRR